ncbi:MAG TPA: UbiA family prenyltransferase [Candidatus Binatia bacterium]|nr:UbiA family prenyltransferase [Candidatus Binatia bacterium]
MSAPEAALEEACAPAPVAARAASVGFVGTSAGTLRAIAWAMLASTLHRIRRGEGALLAINLSLIVQQTATVPRALAQAAVSALAIATMYAFNDLWDAPTDWRNPKKDRALIAAYVEHRRGAIGATLLLKLLALGLSLAALGPAATAAVAAVMVVNVIYSVALKGVPVVDVAWVWVWGVLYAAIVEPPLALLVVVGLMTATCHLFQALDDRVPDAANGIRTTAVRSPTLARNVLVVVSLLLCLSLQAPFGTAGAVTAFTPLVLFFTVGNPGTGWVLTKAYFGVVWLCLLGMSGAAG